MKENETRFTVCIEPETVALLDSLVPKGSRTEIVRAMLRMLGRTLAHEKLFLFALTEAQNDESKGLGIKVLRARSFKSTIK